MTLCWTASLRATETLCLLKFIQCMYLLGIPPCTFLKPFDGNGEHWQLYIEAFVCAMASYYSIGSQQSASAMFLTINYHFWLPEDALLFCVYQTCEIL